MGQIKIDLSWSFSFQDKGEVQRIDLGSEITALGHRKRQFHFSSNSEEQ